MRSRSWLPAVVVMTALLLFPMLERLGAQHSTGIMISEFRFRGPNGINDEFVELFNGGLTPVNIGGWLVRASNNTATPTVVTRVTIPTGTVINRGCYYLVTNVNATGGYSGGVPGDRTYTVSFADDGGAAVTRADLSRIDQVGHGANGAFGEGTRLPVLLTDINRGVERLRSATAGYVDSNNNAADFHEVFPGTPQNSTSPCLVPGELGINASASPSPAEQGETVTIAATVSAATLPASTNLQVIGDLTAIGGPANAMLADNGVFPDVTAADNIFTTAVTIPDSNATGPRSLPLGLTDAQGRSVNTVLSLTVNPPAVIYLPHDIQGPGASSPLPGGTAVIVRGVVTARARGGFYLQTVPGMEDADPNSSEGLFVFVSSGAPAQAQVGHHVQVRGSVAEFVPENDPGSAPRTQLNLVTSVLDLGASTMPPAFVLTAAELSDAGALRQLERLEGMRVTAASLTSTTGTGGEKNEEDATSTSNGTFYAVLTGQSRPFREAGVERGYPVLPCAVGPCHIPIFDGNPERLRVDSDALEGAVAVDITAGAVMADVTGPLDFRFRTYTLLPEVTLNPAGGVAVAPAPAAAADQFTIASFNMDRFVDATNDPGDVVVLTPLAYQTRLAKASLAIRTVLNNPDVLGVQEVENLGVLQQLSARIDADALAAGATVPEYAAVLYEGTHVGALVKTAGGRVSVFLVEQISSANVMLRATIQGPATSLPQTVTVIVNHLRSLADVASNTAAGAAARAERHAQAAFLATYIQDRQLNDPNEAIVSIGDYNAFGFNDGYVDTVGTILGTPAPEDQVAVASTDLVSPDLVNLADFIAESERYSSLHNGNAQALEHALVTANLVSQFAGLVYPRVNADFPESLRGDAATPQRLSDRDPAVVYFTFPPDLAAPVFSFKPENQEVEAASAAGASVTYAAPTATDNLDGDVSVACEPASGATLPLGNTGVTCTAADAAGNVASVSFTVTVEDTTAPHLTVPDGITAEASSAAGSVVDFTVSATDAVTPAPVVICVPASGSTFALGATTVTCNAADAAGNSHSGSFAVTVADTTAPHLVVPAGVTAEAASAAGSVVHFTVSATDAVTGAPVVACAPASGSMFALGVTTVTCNAADAAGNSDRGAFAVTVVDTTAPHLVVPAGVTAEASSAAGSVVGFTVSATDAVTGAPVVTCAPASGSMFALGATTVTCNAADAAGNSDRGSFAVTVADTTAPHLVVPADINEQATSSAGRVVNFTVSATDAVTASPVVTCAPASGSMFPIGVTIVQCSASDAARNSTSDSFAVTITATVAGRVHGAGTIGSSAARMSFRLDVRESADHVDTGSLVLKIGVNDFSASVADVVFASATREPRPASDSVTFSGVGSWNGRAGYAYQATASDRGEPGRDRDTFTVVVRAPDGSVVASGNGTLTSGNIQSLR